VASAVRVLEQAAVYVATRMQMGYGGTCRYVDLTASDSIRHYFGTEPFTGDAMAFFGVTADAPVVMTVTSSSDATGSGVIVAPCADYTDRTQMSEFQVPISIGDGDSGDLAINLWMQLSAVITTQTLRIWYFLPHPIALAAGSEVTI
jgi:hypothetical protein